jgi:hypothetical protein
MTTMETLKDTIAIKYMAARAGEMLVVDMPALAKESYKMAEAMLAERERQGAATLDGWIAQLNIE